MNNQLVTNKHDLEAANRQRAERVVFSSKEHHSCQGSGCCVASPDRVVRLSDVALGLVQTT